jgi:hypothetical protein
MAPTRPWSALGHGSPVAPLRVVGGLEAQSPGRVIELLRRRPDVLGVGVDHRVDDVVGARVTGGRLQQPGDGGEPRAAAP